MDVERKKVARNITYRPNQDKFKRNIRTAYGGMCLISQVGVVNVLQAAHIKPVEHNGNDRIENGILLRADLHILFDSGHLRIDPNGSVRLTETIRREPKYPYHGMQLNIPDFVNRDYLDWRFKYWK
jgi:predicted restriction endonuclease